MKTNYEGNLLANVDMRATNNEDGIIIGLAPKHSRVQIIEVLDNWFKIKIIAWGSPKLNSGDEEVGWVRRRFITI